MTFTKSNQKGFGAIESLLVLIVILMIGFIGYYVYHTSQKTTDTYNASTEVSNNTIAKDKKAAKVASDEQASITPTSYLDLRGWGLKLPLTTDVSSVTAGSYSGSDGSDGYGLHFDGCLVAIVTKHSGSDTMFQNAPTTFTDAYSSSQNNKSYTLVKLTNLYYWIDAASDNPSCSSNTAATNATKALIAQFPKLQTD